MAPPDAFTPARPVTVIVPYYEAPEALGRTLAALETQDWPRELFEVIVVDDGSRVPLERPSTPLDLRVERQEHRGFGAARARNTGVEAAAHDILLFLDGDMLPEAGWIAAHARWHHAASCLLTLGFRAHVSMDGVSAAAIRQRPGTLQDLFADRPADPSFVERHMARTRDLTSRDDDLFRVVVSSNCGIDRQLYEIAGGFDESFIRWGHEDTEFGYRVQTRGGVLVPVRAAFAWHQGRRAEDRKRKNRSLRIQASRVAHLVAHEDFRDARPGRIFAVPQYVVTVETGHLPVDRIVETTESILADRVHDLVVRIEMPEGDHRLEWVRGNFGSDPRVRVGPATSSLDEFPAAAFHVAVPASASFARDLVHRLRCELGPAAVAQATLADGSMVCIARAWALHRARRTARPAGDFGNVVMVPARRLRVTGRRRPRGMVPAAVQQSFRDLRAKVRKVLARLQRIRTPRQAWWFLQWLAGVVVWGMARLLPLRTRRRPPAAIRQGKADGSHRPLGAEIAVLGRRARAVFAATRRVFHRIADRHVDVVVADTPADATAVHAPLAVLSESSAQLSVPAFDPLVDNPIGWRRDVPPLVGALGPLEHLPPGTGARRVVDRRDRVGLRWIHHLEDVQAFHASAVERAGELARLAAAGVVVHLADGDARLRPHLGPELHDLLLTDVRDADLAARESLSIRMRRAALREHALRSRARQICEAVLPDPPRLPLVSILLVTRRPELLPDALARVARQKYPRLELVLGLHGDGFDEAERHASELRLPSKMVRAAAHEPFGSVLNTAVSTSSGTLLAKMDDDDLYDDDHVWDLVLAREYSQAELVGKGTEFVYLAGSNRTVHCFRDGGESYADPTRCDVGGGALLIARHDLDQAGGWRRVRRDVDRALVEDVFRVGGRVYRTHGAGFVLVRHGRGHTWKCDDDYFLKHADAVRPGWDPTLADLADVPPPA